MERNGGATGLPAPITLDGMTTTPVPAGAELAHARRVAERFLANVETVVHGKHDEIMLVLTALACKGHVLFED
ncbi:MAG: hypothetical protein K0T00_2478, partial [Gaiellaceae bacterium]|nr:hypothetical protein [Gaiellaceae bacterium]